MRVTWCGFTIRSITSFCRLDVYTHNIYKQYLYCAAVQYKFNRINTIPTRINNQSSRVGYKLNYDFRLVQHNTYKTKTTGSLPAPRNLSPWTSPTDAQITPTRQTPGMPPPRAETINFKNTKPKQNLAYHTHSAYLARWRFVDHRTHPSSRPVDLFFKVDAKETNSWVTSIKQDIRTKPRLTTSPVLPLHTPANEPVTAWQGM